MFQYRHRITTMDLETHQKIHNPKIKDILVCGSSGFIGSALIPFLCTGGRGYSVTRLLRSKPSSDYDIAKRGVPNFSVILPDLLMANLMQWLILMVMTYLGLWTKRQKAKDF